jgi:hypothetical protein
MGNSGSPSYRARRRERERQWRQHLQQVPVKKARSDPAAAEVVGHERRTAATTCAWCGGPITPRRRGPIPKWCSATCRHRAWEQTRAASSGLSAVDVVERRVEVRVPVAPTRRDSPRLLGELAHQLNDGRVYDRDLPGLARQLEPLLAAYGDGRTRPEPRGSAEIGHPDFCGSEVRGARVSSPLRSTGRACSRQRNSRLSGGRPSTIDGTGSAGQPDVPARAQEVR